MIRLMFLMVVCVVCLSCFDEDKDTCRANSDCPNVQQCRQGTCGDPDGYDPDRIFGDPEDVGVDDAGDEDATGLDTSSEN